MLDKTIPYIDVIMKRDAHTSLPACDLPEGCKIVYFQEDDEIEWAKIETAVGEFDSEMHALIYFQKTYLPYLDELKRRCVFIEDKDGKKIATFTIWWNYWDKKRVPCVHWVATEPNNQGKGLGKALIMFGISLAIEIEGDCDIFLHTQTWSYKAINIYRKAGFNIQIQDEVIGYNNRRANEALKMLECYFR